MTTKHVERYSIVQRCNPAISRKKFFELVEPHPDVVKFMDYVFDYCGERFYADGCINHIIPFNMLELVEAKIFPDLKTATARMRHVAEFLMGVIWDESSQDVYARNERSWMFCYHLFEAYEHKEPVEGEEKYGDEYTLYFCPHINWEFTFTTGKYGFNL